MSMEKKGGYQFLTKAEIEQIKISSRRTAARENRDLLGEVLQVMRESGWSDRGIANKSGVSTSTLARWQQKGTYRRRPVHYTRADTLLMVLRTLGKKLIIMEDR